MLEPIPMPKEDSGRIAIKCATCGNPIRLRGTNVFPICKECISILKTIIAERKK